MTTKFVVSDGKIKRVPTLDEWENFYQSKFPELVRRLRQGSLDPEKVIATIQCLIEGKIIVDTNPIFTRCLTVKNSHFIKETFDRKIIDKAENVFVGGVSPNFHEWGINLSPSRPETFVDIYELIKSGTFEDVYKSFDCSLDCLCLTQNQIIDFVENYKRQILELNSKIFFLIKIDIEFFVVCVNSNFYAEIYHFPYKSFWFAEQGCCFVLPQSARTF